MPLDAGDIIRAGGGLCLFAVGAFMAIAGRARKTNILLGAFVGLYGAHFVAFNFFAKLPQSSIAGLYGTGALWATVSVLGLVMALRWPTPLKTIEARWLVVPFLVLVASVPPTLPAFEQIATFLDTDGGPNPALRARILQISVIEVALLSLLVAVWAERLVRLPRHSPDATAIVFVTLGVGLDHALRAGIQLQTGLAIVPAFGPDWAFIAWAMVLCILWWLRPSLGVHRRRAAGVLLLFLAVATTGLLVLQYAPPQTMSDIGTLGLLRTVGASVLAFAVFRRNLLGVPLRPITLRAGPLAAAGLAALFITAQVAQNFLSDELGLYLGGAVAGVVVFAAYPLQRAAERRLQSPGNEEAFRRAVTLALRDRILKPQEERDLLLLAGRLGLPTDRAYAILDEHTSRGSHGA